MTKDLCAATEILLLLPAVRHPTLYFVLKPLANPEEQGCNNVIHLLATALQVYSYILLGRIILSWIPNIDRTNAIVQFLYQVTEPVLEPVRRNIPPLGMIDISPIVVFIGLQIVQSILRGIAGDL